MGVNLMFEAGRLAERRGWVSAEVVEMAALGSVLPGPGQVIVVVSEVGLSVADARAVAALTASGKEVAVISGVAPSDDVLAWLPKGCLYTVGEPLGSGWTVTDGLVVLAHDGFELWDESILEGLPMKHADGLAEAVRQVTVGVAWDRPIYAPSTHECYGGILNSDGGYGRFPMRGMRDEEYLRFEEGDLTRSIYSNPLRMGLSSPILTLNVSLDGSPMLLVCGPYFEEYENDYSFCWRDGGWTFVGRDVVTDMQLARLQARPRMHQQGLMPLPGWLDSLPSESRDVVFHLCDAWASGFFRAVVAWGIDFFRRHGKDLDAALQADWQTLLDRLEQRA